MDDRGLARLPAGHDDGFRPEAGRPTGVV